ncbi:hypothetical protein BLNAU_17023 [Blattamonas nauphoetae]|uniref:Uncharacterized protein n=1 Tax=Blattamonas nauphoetae TaxID=2049346 RepID=A0ABQ9X7V0_9EUKA|nr:hypothetical protein BLNAU_17023 [Blattamonas nauphoetae]
MTTLDSNMDTVLETSSPDISWQAFTICTDSSTFLNWSEEELESEEEKAILFRSLVATLKLQPALDASLEAKALKFLKSVNHYFQVEVDAFLGSFGRTTDLSSTAFVQSIVVLISTPNQAITTAVMKMLRDILTNGSTKVLLALVKNDLIPQLINTLNPQSISLTAVEDTHINLISYIVSSLFLITPSGLVLLQITGRDEQQHVYETVFKQVLAPSEKYICHLCVNRYSIIDGDQSYTFLTLLPQLLEICPYYQPTMDLVLNMPVVLTIPSCLTFVENDNSIWIFLYNMNNSQREWNETMREEQQMGKIVLRMLRMEGVEDVTEQRLLNDDNTFIGRLIVAESKELNNQQGMNVQKR